MWTNALSGWHLVLIIAVLVLVFGSKKLPDAARSLGKSMRIFKSEVRELQHEGKTEDPPKPNPVQSERVDKPAPDQNHTDARPA
jgi:sec-independent protein translocase protein TatA